MLIENYSLLWRKKIDLSWSNFGDVANWSWSETYCLLPFWTSILGGYRFSPFTLPKLLVLKSAFLPLREMEESWNGSFTLDSSHGADTYFWIYLHLSLFEMVQLFKLIYFVVDFNVFFLFLYFMWCVFVTSMCHYIHSKAGYISSISW